MLMHLSGVFAVITVIHVHKQGFASVILTLFAKSSWRSGDRDSAIRLATWAKYVAIASIVLGIATVIIAVGATRGGRYNNYRYNNNYVCRYYGNC
jgi:heme A synthase